MKEMLGLRLRLRGHRRIDFEAKRLRPILRRLGNEVRNDARRLIARKAISKAGEYPGQTTGRTKKSLIVRISRAGYAAIVEPKKEPWMTARSDFYPSILTYGTAHIKPRKNYIVDAAQRRRNAARQAIYEGLRRALRPI